MIFFSLLKCQNQKVLPFVPFFSEKRIINSHVKNKSPDNFEELKKQ